MTHIDSLLSEIDEDHTSGSTLLMIKSAKLFKSFFMSQKDHSENLYKELVSLGIKLISSKPHMASIINLVDDILHFYKQTPSLSECIGFLDAQGFSSYHFYEMAAKEFSSVKKVFTHSYSHSVFLFLKALKNFSPHLHVTLTESRPLNEGVRLMEDLSEGKIQTTLVTDAAALTMLPETDLLVLGSDFIANKSFSNKVGSLAIALGARYFKKPLYIMADKTKYISLNHPTLIHNTYPKEEVLDESEFHIENPYFETIPIKWVKKILTPEGAFSFKEAKRKTFKKYFYNKFLLKYLST